MQLIVIYILGLLLNIFLMWSAIMLCSSIHEMGHAIGYMITAKDNNWSIQLGIGKKLFTIKKFTFCLVPFSGYFMPSGQKSLSKNQTIAMCIGGPIANIFLLILLYLFKNNIIFLVQVRTNMINMASIMNYCMEYSIWMLIASALPINNLGYVSDGYKVYESFKKKNKSSIY